MAEVDRDTRDKNLDALKAAVKEWTKKEKERLENEVKFMRAVLQGRGASNAAAKNLESASLKAVVEINSFLSGV